MKTNFILTKNSLGEFLKRYNKLLNKTGMLRCIGHYRGAKKLNVNLPFKRKNYIEKTCPSYHDIDKIKFMPIKSGLVIRIHDDASDLIEWGTEMKWSPTHLKIKRKKLSHSNNFLRISTLSPTLDIDKGKMENHRAEIYALEYYKSLNLS